MYGMSSDAWTWILTLAIACPTALLAWAIFWVAQVRQQYWIARHAKHHAEAARDEMIAATSKEAIARMEQK
jgi:hypothetical protein